MNDPGEEHQEAASPSLGERLHSSWQQTTIRGLRVALGTGLSLVFLWLAFRDVPPSQVIAILNQADYRFVALALVLVLISPLARAARWRLLYHPDEDGLSYFRLAEVLLIGQMLNIAAPARLGEVARIYLMSRVENRSRARTLGTIVVEKWLDILMLLLLVLLVPMFVSPPPWFRDPRRGLAILATAFLVTAMILSCGKDRLFSLVGSLSRFLPRSWRVRIQQEVERAMGCLDPLRSPWVGFRLQGWALFIWVLSILVNYVLFLAFGLPLSLTAALFLLAVLQVGVAVPSVPGKLGVFYCVCPLALAPFGVEKSAALSYAVLLYFVVFGPPLLLGALFLWWESVQERRVEPAAWSRPCPGEPH